ncbi:hypothetical protein OC834_000480 [Tilletia horrida]|uniref:Uncharacterized protein n=1 Tax=Tilletia horrida TaxID=155126 RepID=A0AAN6JIB9_9BASI|nr:hypothetical protein OC842_005757 [Tilletia horrida]KAK0538332.1 hypothetical protein OC834_000480 [Tilletia horrida]KAK0564232.1 hypothetical protein OC844_001819 [Tilletia horrida]
MPSEILVHILRYALVPVQVEQENMQAFIRRGTRLKLICKKFNASLIYILSKHFHAFGFDLGMTAVDFPWHPQAKSLLRCNMFWINLHGSWWRHYPRITAVSHGLATSNIEGLLTLSLDLRREPPPYGIDTPSRNQLPLCRQRINAMLTRLLMSATRLEELYIRLSPDVDAIHIVEHLICNNPALRCVLIEIDCSGRSHPAPATVRLNNMVEAGTLYSRFQCFILRCPGVKVQCHDDDGNSDRFFARLSGATQFALSAEALDTGAAPWSWLNNLFRNSPKLQECQFTVDMHTYDDFGSTADAALHQVCLPDLTDLVIEAPGLDSAFFQRLDAPHLANLRVRSDVPVDHWPQCSPNRFPLLSTANILCPGVSAQRLIALGLSPSTFHRNLDYNHNFHVYHHEEFAAAIHAPEGPSAHVHEPDFDFAHHDASVRRGDVLPPSKRLRLSSI